mmetsp:Transcript_35617/g.93494  ORF Transcript_35617/g.93494 Transcript_35617/m.93494 type:complete len:112 (-) Transcript_35617:48-383(-)
MNIVVAIACRLAGVGEATQTCDGLGRWDAGGLNARFVLPGCRQGWHAKRNGGMRLAAEADHEPRMFRGALCQATAARCQARVDSCARNSSGLLAPPKAVRATRTALPLHVI